MSGNRDRNVDCDWLLLIDCKEIHVQASVSYRVELELVKNSGVLLSVEVEVNYIGARSVGDGLEFLCIYCEENVLESETVEIARNESLCAEGLDGSLVANLTKLAFEFNVLHLRLFFKMCYSVRSPGPHCTKTAWR